MSKVTFCYVQFNRHKIHFVADKESGLLGFLKHSVIFNLRGESTYCPLLSSMWINKTTSVHMVQINYFLSNIKTSKTVVSLLIKSGSWNHWTTKSKASGWQGRDIVGCAQINSDQFASALTLRSLSRAPLVTNVSFPASSIVTAARVDNVTPEQNGWPRLLHSPQQFNFSVILN